MWLACTDDATFCPACGAPVRPTSGLSRPQEAIRSQGLSEISVLPFLLVGFAVAGLVVGVTTDAEVGGILIGYLVAGTIAGVSLAIAFRRVLPALNLERAVFIVATWSLAWIVSLSLIASSWTSTILEDVLGAIGTVIVLRSFKETSSLRWFPVLLGWVASGILANLSQWIIGEGMGQLVVMNIIEGTVGGMITVREIVRARRDIPSQTITPPIVP
jgi:hypothetical protein